MRNARREHKSSRNYPGAPPQSSAHDEAMRQLGLACRDGAIPVTGDLIIKSAGGLVVEREREIPAAEIREMPVGKRVIFTHRGTLINVKLRIAHIDRVWPRPPDDAAACSLAVPAFRLPHHAREAHHGK